MVPVRWKEGGKEWARACPRAEVVKLWGRGKPQRFSDSPRSAGEYTDLCCFSLRVVGGKEKWDQLTKARGCLFRFGDKFFQGFNTLRGPGSPAFWGPWRERESRQRALGLGGRGGGEGEELLPPRGEADWAGALSLCCHTVSLSEAPGLSSPCSTLCILAGEEKLVRLLHLPSGYAGGAIAIAFFSE